MSGDNTDSPGFEREPYRRRATQAALDIRESLAKGQDQVAAMHALYFWLYDEVARAEDPEECVHRMEEMLRRCWKVQNWNPDRPRPTLRLVVNNTV